MELSPFPSFPRTGNKNKERKYVLLYLPRQADAVAHCHGRVSRYGPSQIDSTNLVSWFTVRCKRMHISLFTAGLLRKLADHTRS